MKQKIYKQEESLEKYIKTKSVVNFNRNNLPQQENTIEYEGLSVLPALEICNKPRQKKIQTIIIKLIQKINRKYLITI